MGLSRGVGRVGPCWTDAGGLGRESANRPPSRSGDQADREAGRRTDRVLVQLKSNPRNTKHPDEGTK